VLINCLIKRLALPLFLVSIAACQQVPSDKIAAPMFSFMPVPEQLNGQWWLEKFQFSGIVEESMLVSTEFTAPTIKVVALTFEGVPLSQLQYDTQTHNLESSNMLGVDLDGKKIIYDMQSAFWPLSALENNRRSDVTIEEKTLEQHRARLFYRNKTLVRKITYNGAVTILTEYEQNYRLKIERLEEY